MHQRLLVWLIACAIGTIGSLRAQAPAAGATMPPGLVLVARTTGTVSMILDGVTTALKQDDKVPQTATVKTAPASSAVLVFSNGATTQLGEDTELVIQEFLQDPFAAQIQVAAMQEEPSTSRTRLKLNKGELVGNVKKLQHAQGSTFTIETPVGAAGIRGTTFRIVFRPTGQGLAFFSLSTVEGNVAFANPGNNAQAGGQNAGAGNNAGANNAGGNAGGNGGGNPPAGGPGNAGGNPGGGGAGVSVGGGQEVVITVNVNVNANTGAVTVTAPPTVSSNLVVPISTATQALVVQQAQTMAVATATASFTSSAGAGVGGNPGPSGTTGTTAGSNTGAGNTGNSGNTNPAGNNNTPPPPPPVQQQRVTTGDGLG